MNEHLFDQIMAQLPRPVAGEIVGVKTGDTLTTYDLIIWPQTAGFTGAFQFSRVLYLGQQAGGSCEKHTPLVVGQKVAVEFAEGDYNRPLIVDLWPDDSTQIPSDDAHRWRINGVQIAIDVEGNVTLQLPQNKGITISNHSGNQVVRVLENGSVELGDGTLRRLIDERIVEAFNTHTHPTPAGPSSVPTSLIVVGAVATTDVRGS